MDKKMLDMYVRSLVNKEASGNNEATAADGGNVLGIEISKEIFNRMVMNSSIISSANKINIVKGNTVKVPYNNDLISVNESDQGARAYWIDEAAIKTINIPLLGSASMTLGKLVVRIPYTDELFNDRNDLVDWLTVQASDAIKNKLEYGMLFNASGSVLGIAGTDATGEQATVESGFSATPTEDQLVAAYKLLNPLAINGAVWYVSKDTYANLAAETYDVINKEDNMMYILGLPVEISPWLDSSFHILLGNFKGYCLVNRDPSILIGDQIRFEYDESEFRLVYRVAGQPIVENKTIDSVECGWFIKPDPNVS